MLFSFITEFIEHGMGQIDEMPMLEGSPGYSGMERLQRMVERMVSQLAPLIGLGEGTKPFREPVEAPIGAHCKSRLYRLMTHSLEHVVQVLLDV